jgi:hypothetical protein
MTSRDVFDAMFVGLAAGGGFGLLVVLTGALGGIVPLAVVALIAIYAARAVWAIYR